MATLKEIQSVKAEVKDDLKIITDRATALPKGAERSAAEGAGVILLKTLTILDLMEGRRLMETKLK